MATKNNRKLTDLEVRRAAPGKHGDTEGLWLYVAKRQDGQLGRKWIYKFRSPVSGKDREMGLGTFPAVSLQDARDARDGARKLVRSGADPVDERNAERTERVAVEVALAKRRTFDEVAAEVVAKHGVNFENAKHRWQWQATLTAHASPSIGAMAMEDITVDDIVGVLEPVLSTAPETARRLRGRLAAVFAYAAADEGYRGLDPARLKAESLRTKLPALKKKSAEVEHHAALAIDDMPDFMATLAALKGDAAACVRFIILTASRSLEVRGMRWGEVDFKTATWIVSKERMKRRISHRVALSEQAVALLQSMKPKKDNGEDAAVGADALVFNSPTAKRVGKGLTDMAVLRVVQRLKPDVTLHGTARSTFADWVHMKTGYADKLVETALAHAVGTKVSRAYAREDLLELRRPMMQAWGDYCAPQAAGSNVVPITAKAAA